MTPEQALDRTVSEVAPLVRAREISPVALAEASLARLEGEGRALNAVATVTSARALEEARANFYDAYLSDKPAPPLQPGRHRVDHWSLEHFSECI